MSRRARQRQPAIEAKRAAAWSGPEPEPVDDSEGGEADVRPKRCEPCRATGAVHCSDPENCGGPWDKRNDARPMCGA